MFKNKGLLMRIALVLTISLIMNQTYIVNASEDILLADAVSYGELLGDDSAQEAELLADEPADELITETPAEKNNEELIPEPIAETMEILADKAPSESENNIASGKYGNVTWVIDKDGKLTVSGEGDFIDGTTGLTPWFEYKEQILSAEVNLTGTSSFDSLLTDCSNVESVDLTGLDTSNATSMAWMFSGCSSLETLDVSGFDTSHVTNMDCMFNGCKRLKEIDVSGFDTSNVTNMMRMFGGCSKVEFLDIKRFNTSNVVDMCDMFNGCSSLESLDVSGFRTSKVTNFSGMFNSCISLKEIDVSGFDTSNATNVASMFGWCEGLKEINVTGFDTSKVTEIRGMFGGCSALRSLDVSGFDTSKATRMGFMFQECKRLKSLDVSGFDTSNVTEMYNMFDGCSSLETLDVSKFDTSHVTEMEKMFYGCSALTSLDVSRFDTSKVINMHDMFYGCSSLTSLDVSGFDTSSVTNMSSMFSGCSSLASLDVSGFDTSKATLLSFMFNACRALTMLDVSGFDTSKVTYMSYMFSSCNELTTLDVSGFDTSKVTDMMGMFSGCFSLETLDLSSFNTSNVETAADMLYACSSLTSIKVPRNLKNDTDLPATFVKKSDHSVEYTKLPLDVTTSFEIIRQDTLSSNITGVSVMPTSKEIYVGGSYQLSANVIPNDAADKRVTWTSADPAIASVDASGMVTGKTVGTTTITVRTIDGLHKATCSIMVSRPPVKVTEITVTPTLKELYVNEKFTISANVLPENADNKKIIWSIDNSEVATVDSKGNVTAKAVGEAKISATTEDGGFSDTCKVIVKEKPVEVQSIVVTPSAIRVYIGEKTKLTAAIIPANASDKTVSWKSNNAKVATVADDGTVTAVAKGEAIIEAGTSNGLKATSTVTVEKLPVRVTGVSVSPTSVTLEEGESLYIDHTVSPADADDKSVTYRMSPNGGDIISLGDDGKVTALKEGTAVVTVVTNDGDYEADCTVIVIKPSDPEPEEEQEVDNTETDVEHKEEIDFEVEDQDGYLKLHVEDAKAPGLRVQIYNDPVLKTYPKVRCFDIYLEDEQKRRIKNFGRCTIWIPLDADMDPSNGIAVVTTGEDGRTESLPATAVLKNGVMCAKFETTHFTYFAILCGDFIHDTLNEDTTPIGGKSNTTTRSSSSSTSTTSSSSTTGRSSNSSSTTDILKMVTQSSSPTPAYGSANSAATAANSTDRTGGKSGSNGSSRTKDSVPKTGDRKWLE